MRPAYLNPNPLPQQIQHTYQNLGRQFQVKPSLYGAGQRKYNNNFHKFQIGTTTTFNGYTNITGFRPTNIPPRPAPRRLPPQPTPTYQHNEHTPTYTYNQQHYPQQNYYNDNNNNLPSLFDINPFHTPSRHNTRTYHQAQQYNPNQQQHHYPRSLSRTRFQVLSQLPSQSRSRSTHRLTIPPPIKPRRTYQQQQQQQQPQYNRHIYQQRQQPTNTTTTTTTTYNNRTLQGLIISDSMCSRIRTYTINKLPLYNVELSYESGCDIIKMINWLQTSEGQSTVGNKEFLVICLGTNDVGQYGVEVTLQRCSEFIRFIRQSFPGIRAIGWLALSPRWKPTRFVSAADIGGLHSLFNEHLQILSKQLDFDVVDARLGPLDMRVEDGLHPSNTTGKWKYEGALREWFSYRIAAHTSSSISFQHRRTPSPAPIPAPRITTAPTYATIVRRNNNNYNDNQQNYTTRQVRPFSSFFSSSSSVFCNNKNNNNSINTTRQVGNFSPSYFYDNNNNNNNRNINNTQPFTVTTDRIDRTDRIVVEQVNRNSRQQINFPSKSLIKEYPHKLRIVEQFFRDNQPSKEIEKEKDKLFLAANIYYQKRYFEEESKKWKIYEQVASRKVEEDKEDREDIEMLDLEEIPQARPSRKRYSAILNMTVSDTDSQENENSNNENENKEEASNENSSSSSNSEMDEDDRKKRKLQDTSLSPNSKTVKENSIRKKKSKSKKKKRIAIENDPRAPQGSPFLLVSENNREQIAAREATNTRQDTPTDPAAKKQRLFSHVPLPQRVKNRHHLEQIEKEKNSQSNENSPIELPKTPPGIIEPLRLSPRQSTPRTPVAVPIPISYSPTIAVTTEQIRESIPLQSVITIEEEPIVAMEQDIVSHSPSVISKESDINRIDLFKFPIIPIECQFHFRVFHVAATSENIKAHREFLEKKSIQQERDLEQLMSTFSIDLQRIIVKYIKDSVEPLIDRLNSSNQKRLNNLLLDQMREKAVRIIRNKADKDSFELVEKTQMRLERTLELKFQLDKLDRRLNENMPPPALNIMDKLQFHSRELSNENKEQYSEQWNSIIRKAKLDLTSIMRIAKVAEIDKSNKEHSELVEKIPREIKKAVKDLEHTIEIRHNRSVQKKLDFLERKARGIIEK
jgi:hypothetical protein